MSGKICKIASDDTLHFVSFVGSFVKCFTTIALDNLFISHYNFFQIPVLLTSQY